MRVLLVEDDEHVAAALSAVLRRHGFDVAHTRDGQQTLEALLPGEAEPFGVVLLDLGLPDQDGFELCGRIRSATSAPVIMVTARSDVRSRIHGLNLGADDYVVKPYDTGELLARIHAVSRRAVPEDGSQTSQGQAASGNAAAAVAPQGEAGQTLRFDSLTIEPLTRQVRVEGVEVPLTRKEFDLLLLLAHRPGVVFRREQIISEVWRTSWEGTGRTLEVHVASLRAKLRLPALIETVRGVGYRLTAPGAR